MTQVALPENVVGAFDGTAVVSDGLTYRVSRTGGEFWAEMPDPDVMMYVVQGGKKLALEDIPRVRERVVMATGSASMHSAAFSPDGRRVVSAGADGNVQILKCTICRPIREILEQAQGRLEEVLTPAERAFVEERRASGN